MMSESKLAWSIVGPIAAIITTFGITVYIFQDALRGWGPVVLFLLLYGIVCVWIGHLISRSSQESIRSIVRDEMQREGVEPHENEPTNELPTLIKIGTRIPTDPECLAIHAAITDGSISKNKMQKLLYGSRGSRNMARLNEALTRAESLLNSQSVDTQTQIQEAIERGSPPYRYEAGEEDDQGFAELIPLRKVA